MFFQPRNERPHAGHGRRSPPLAGSPAHGAASPGRRRHLVTSADSVAARIDRLRAERKFGEADALAHETLSKGIVNTVVRIALGRLEIVRHCNEKALGYFQEAIRFDLSSGTAAAWHIAVLCRLKRFNEAEKTATAVLLKFPSHIEAYSRAAPEVKCYNG